MLTIGNLVTGEYIIAITEVTSDAELIADLSYLLDVPTGHVTFDFTHTAPNLTRQRHVCWLHKRTCPIDHVSSCRASNSSPHTGQKVTCR